MGAYQNNNASPKRTQKKKQTFGNWGGYIDCPMGKAERDTFLAFANNNVISVFDSLALMADSGINLSLSYSDKDSSYLAKATQINPEDNKNYMLSGFHADVETAWLVLIFKHFTLLEADWFGRNASDDEIEHWG